MKGSFEDLLTSLKGELETSRSERDNLRDEIVPQLRARVEGLESETSNLQKFMYEHEHMQQELMVLKTENASLAVAIREKTEQQLQAQATIQAQLEAQAEAQAQAEAEVTMLQSPIPIHNHAVHAHVVQAQLVQIQTQFHSRPVSMAQPFGTPSTPTNPGMVNPKDRESLTERLKDVETQRDALHSALKSLRDRQQIETKKARERIRVLEIERERSLHPSLRKQTRDKEASALRREVYRLRQRADDALEQKFVCERSLGTLMMDLEKAGQETATLRVLLQEHDDLISQHDESKEPHIRLSGEISELKQRPKSEISSVSLQQAYRDLQSLHARSLARLDELESRTVDPSHVSESERRLSSLQEEQNLAAQLRISSERVEELATQVRAQLASNEILRERLADCIGRGEIDQKASAKKINALQDKLRILEDNVIEAQQLAEDAVSQHEDEIRRIQETHTSQLRRLKTGGASSAGLKPSSSPILRSPKLEWTSVRRLSTTDATKTANLEKRVSELERALSDADDEMSEVVSRMNKAQIEVLELQTER